jgi:C4-dicarboxylate transporter, DctM subunit
VSPPHLVTVENIPRTLSVFLQGFDLSPTTFLIIVNILLLALGCLLEGTAIILIVIPVLIRTAQALGVDLVHFGIVCVVNILIGLITPSYGLLLFIMTNIGQVSLRALVRDILPFLYAVLASLIHRREDIYQHSLVSKVATAVIAGLGPKGYATAVRAMKDLIG